LQLEGNLFAASSPCKVGIEIRRAKTLTCQRGIRGARNVVSRLCDIAFLVHESDR
jgi:hypothetical protein